MSEIVKLNRAAALSSPLIMLTIAGALVACGASRPALQADMPPLSIAGAEAIERDPFARDVTGGVPEADLIRAIETPVYLAESTRLGVVPVAVAYEPDEEIPLIEVPEVLAVALEDTGFFTVTSEISTDWPSARSISGLRELAARYRTRYLLLYRHRFVERERVNAWASSFFVVVTIPFVPTKTLETAGVLEATMFDVRTGSLLFTAYERVHAISDENVWGNARKLREMRERLLDEGAERLADKVVDQIHHLVAARPGHSEPVGTRDPMTEAPPVL